jgi:hypothetical protein
MRVFKCGRVAANGLFFFFACRTVLLGNLTLTYVFENYTRIVLNLKVHYSVYKNPLLDS